MEQKDLQSARIEQADLQSAKVISHCKCLYSMRSDCKSDRTDRTGALFSTLFYQPYIYNKVYSAHLKTYKWAALHPHKLSENGACGS